MGRECGEPQTSPPLLACTVLASTILAALVVALVSGIIRANHGYFAYPLDDTYIHMAIAKNLAINGVWGVTEHEFSSSSSSAIWPLVLAALDRLLGPREWIPLLANLICGFALCYVLARQMLLRGASWLHTLLAESAVIVLVPVPVLVVTGMEHTLHLLLGTAFVLLASDGLCQEHNKPDVRVALLAAFLVAARFEGLFFVLPVVLLQVLRRRVLQGAIVAAAALAPLVFQGVASVVHGWYWLPNSILAKTELTAGSNWRILVPFQASMLDKLLTSPHLLIPFLLVLALAVVELNLSRTLWTPRLTRSIVVVSALLLHLRYASLGWLYRYEAYLVGLLILVLLLPDGRIRARLAGKQLWTAVLFGALAIMAIPLASRAKMAHMNTIRAGSLRYREHVVPSRFLARYARGLPIVANDIGAVAFFTRSKVLDLCMLGSLYPLQQIRRNGAFTRAECGKWASSEGAEYAYLNSAWGHEQTLVPDSWILAAQVQIEVGGETKTYSFYDVDGTNPNGMRSALRQAFIDAGVSDSVRIR